MAISRMNMERQLRNMGGLMTLEEPRQGYFLGKIVRKAKKAVKKVVKSPIGKAAIIGALGFGIPGTQIGGLFGRASFGGAAKGLLGNYGIGSTLSTRLPSLFARGNVQRNPGLFRGLMDKFAGLSTGQKLLLGGGAAATLAPFLMGDDEEIIDEGVDVSGVQPMVSNIRQQAIDFYKNPASRADSGLFFMPRQEFVRPFAKGGLADIPREGYRVGGGILQKAGQMIKSGVGKVKSLFDDADINISVRDEDVMTDAGLQAQAVGNDVFITAKSKRATRVLDDLIDAGYDISKDADNNYSINALDEGALDIIAKRLKLGDKNVDEFMQGLPKYVDEMGAEEEMIYDALRQRRADGGIMDLGGMEKDYREGGFVPIGKEERADDVPARLSKNEFVFTADAVRNAGGGDIDKGAEVMQNMMDNLEAGGTISEESQGKENPAQEMFNQAQMLESRIV